jgi:subtilase family serine protease
VLDDEAEDEKEEEEEDEVLEGSGELGGWSPEDLRSAYNIPFSGGAGQTVGVVDEDAAPEAESELAVYRERYDLGPCDKENGCLKVVNMEGNESPLPPTGVAEGEQEEDIEMVSAMCPECHILLVEVPVPYPLEPASRPRNIAAGVNEAAILGATAITNTIEFSEAPGGECGEAPHCTQFASDYDHPGVEIVAAAGDDGYVHLKDGANFPASSPYVIAAGGTVLHRAAKTKAKPRGWTEEVWKGTGSGCSLFEPKPAWQTDPKCDQRTDNDIAAVATDVSERSLGKWRAGGIENGTSLSAPLIAGILAHANSYTRSLGAEAFYQDPSMLFDITKGDNGTCSSYLCTAKTGYDGPSGWGTPDGVPNVPEP